MKELISMNKASKWATDYLGKDVSPSNINYLVQYAKINKYYDDNNNIKVNSSELKQYYDEHIIRKQERWKKQLGDDLNWSLSFDDLKESERTKHVHRLHPYKGKFIPQLVEYFLDQHVNTFKKEVFFKPGNIVLDPFMGSGTTLIQAAELGIHAIGIDVSEFNCLISKVKSGDYNIFELNLQLRNALSKTIEFSKSTFEDEFDKHLKDLLSDFNTKYFPNPEIKHRFRRKELDENKYGQEKLREFMKINKDFVEKNGMKDKSKLLDEKKMNSFLSKWFTKRIRQELFFYIKQIENTKDIEVQNVMRIVLSRTSRSCRATTHYDLATLRNPQYIPYYCRKHKKICTPVNSILGHLKRYTYDTVSRLKEFSKKRKNTQISVIHGDSKTIDILNEVEKQNKELFTIMKDHKIDGIFTSPPYVGQIDYHEQHAYAYEMFDIPRKDDLEIGPLFKGKGIKAREEYVEGVSNVLSNVSKYVRKGGNLFIVANDKYNLYPTIAKKSGLKLVNQFKRPVLNRTERDRQPYGEIIFHMRKG